MSDTIPAAPAAPAVTTPAAPAAPVQQALPNVAPPAAAPPAAPVAAAPEPVAPEAPRRKKHKKGTIRITPSDFQTRVNELVTAGLGVPLEEAKRLLEEAKAKLAGAAAAGVPANQVELQTQIAALTNQVAGLTKERDEAVERSKEIRARERDKREELRIESAARVAGVGEEHLDFALNLYKRRVKDTPDNEALPQASAFFTELRKTRLYLFENAGGTQHAAAPAAPAARPATAPPESRLPGEALPAQSVAAPAGGPDVSKMTQTEFKRHTQEQYGVSLG